MHPSPLPTLPQRITQIHLLEISTIFHRVQKNNFHLQPTDSVPKPPPKPQKKSDDDERNPKGYLFSKIDFTHRATGVAGWMEIYILFVGDVKKWCRTKKLKYAGLLVFCIVRFFCVKCVFFVSGMYCRAWIKGFGRICALNIFWVADLPGSFCSPYILAFKHSLDGQGTRRHCHKKQRCMMQQIGWLYRGLDFLVFIVFDSESDMNDFLMLAFVCCKRYISSRILFAR